MKLVVVVFLRELTKERVGAEKAYGLSDPHMRLGQYMWPAIQDPPMQCRTYHRKWARLVGILYIITPSLSGSGALFYHLIRKPQKALSIRRYPHVT